MASTRRYPVIPQAGTACTPPWSCAPGPLKSFQKGESRADRLQFWPRPQPIPVPQRRSAPRTPPLPIRSLGALRSTSTWMTSRRTKSLKGTCVPRGPLPGAVFWVAGSTASQYVRATGYAVHTNGVSQRPYQVLFRRSVTRRPAKGGFHSTSTLFIRHPTLPDSILSFPNLRLQIQYYPSFLTLDPEIYIPSFPPPPLQKDMNRDGRQATRQSESRLRRTSSPLRWAGPTEEGRPS